MIEKKSQVKKKEKKKKKNKKRGKNSKFFDKRSEKGYRSGVFFFFL